MNQVILFLLILNPLNTRQVIQEILICWWWWSWLWCKQSWLKWNWSCYSSKHFSDFWRTLNIPLVNCEVELILIWSKNCVLADMTAADNPPTKLEFQITDTKLYVQVVTLSKQNDKKLLQQLKSGFKRTVKWNKYKSQVTIQPQNKSLNYLIDPMFTKVNRLFVLSFARNAEGDHRHSFSNYFVPNVRMKDFNVLIDGKSFFYLQVKDEEETTKKLLRWVEIMTTQLVIYWILLIPKRLQTNYN